MLVVGELPTRVVTLPELRERPADADLLGVEPRHEQLRDAVLLLAVQVDKALDAVGRELRQFIEIQSLAMGTIFCCFLTLFGRWYTTRRSRFNAGKRSRVSQDGSLRTLNESEFSAMRRASSTLPYCLARFQSVSISTTPAIHYTLPRLEAWLVTVQVQRSQWGRRVAEHRDVGDCDQLQASQSFEIVRTHADKRVVLLQYRCLWLCEYSRLTCRRRNSTTPSMLALLYVARASIKARRARRLIT